MVLIGTPWPESIAFQNSIIPLSVTSREAGRSASQRKMDLTFEGKQREYFCEDGAWKDVLLYSMLRGEWDARYR
jgi:hypothetical protein